MEIVYLIVLVAYMALKTWFVESKNDMAIINDMGDNPTRKWKFWGNTNEFLGVAAIVAILAFFTAWQSLFLLPILWGVFWITHDFAMGYRLGKGIWYVSDKGFDGKMLAVCQDSGILYFIVKLVYTAAFVTLYLGL
jgi:hypothetical protein